MNREYHKWFSPALHRDMEVLVFGHSGTPVLFFPTRTAHFYDYENWHIIKAIQHKIDQGQLQIYCVDSVDAESFYAPIHPADKIKRHQQYEEYVMNEVLSFIKTKNTNPFLISAGCSLGGYHAVNIALRNPQHFNKAVGMSARYDLTLSTNKFPDLMNGYFDESVYFNMPSMYIANMADDSMLDTIRKLKITLVIGREDPFLGNNMYFSDMLATKKIDHNFYVWDEEAHRPKYWRKMVDYYI